MSYIFEGQEKKILDVTCGSRTIWFDKQNAHTLYCDKRKEHYQLEWKSTRKPSVLDCEVNPDVQCDFTDLPFPDGQVSGSRWVQGGFKVKKITLNRKKFLNLGIIFQKISSVQVGSR